MYMGRVTLCSDQSLKTDGHIRLPLTKSTTKTKTFSGLCHDKISVMVCAYILLKIYECRKLPLSFLMRARYILSNRPKFEPQ